MIRYDNEPWIRHEASEPGTATPRFARRPLSLSPSPSLSLSPSQWPMVGVKGSRGGNMKGWEERAERHRCAVIPLLTLGLKSFSCHATHSSNTLIEPLPPPPRSSARLSTYPLLFRTRSCAALSRSTPAIKGPPSGDQSLSSFVQSYDKCTRT